MAGNAPSTLQWYRPGAMLPAVRYLLLDRITLLEAEHATALKCVSLADDVFVDHFPGHPVMPRPRCARAGAMTCTRY